MPTRARRALDKLDAPTLLDLAALPCYEMYKVPRCGRKTAREIQKAMLDVIERGPESLKTSMTAYPLGVL